MKSTSLLAPALALALASTGFAAPQPAVQWKQVVSKRRSQLPADIRARLPIGAVTLHLGRLPIGPASAPMLVHIWAAKRASQPGSYWPMEQAPMCVDVFSQSKNRFTRAASAVFLSDELPQDISARWLYPAKKQGPVLVLVSPSYTSTKYTLVVFPKGVGVGDENPGFVQHLYQGGVGGGKILQNFGVDADGVMMVETENSLYGKTQSKTQRRWNGYEFQAPAP